MLVWVSGGVKVRMEGAQQRLVALQGNILGASRGDATQIPQRGAGRAQPAVFSPAWAPQ